MAYIREYPLPPPPQGYYRLQYLTKRFLWRPLFSRSLKTLTAHIFLLTEWKGLGMTWPNTHRRSTIGLFSNRTGTSVDDGKARGTDLTRLPVPKLPLYHWSRSFFILRAPSLADVNCRSVAKWLILIQGQLATDMRTWHAVKMFKESSYKIKKIRRLKS